MDFRYSISTNNSISVPTSSTPILSANPNRCYAIVVNDSAVKAYLFKGSPATTNGIPLMPNGGFFEITALNLYTGALTAITASGTATLKVEET